MKKKYLVTVDGDRYIWQRIDDCSNRTSKKVSFVEVIRKTPGACKNIERDRRRAIKAVLFETAVVVGLSWFMFKNITIIAAFVALSFTILLGPLSQTIKSINTKLILFLIVYPGCMLFYIGVYKYIETIDLLSRDHIGDTLTAIALAITVIYELYKVLEELVLAI